ncbi:MAG: ATPase, T2SS/T4P/T4SS family [bacterium]|nr:ATPase, T2SS/T4P/T4SS family [bacterium]
MQVKEEKLKELIIDSGLVSKKDLDSALSIAKKKDRTFGDVLISEGYLSEQDFRRFEAYALGIPYVSLENETINFDILSLIPEPIARKHNVIAFRKSDDGLEVAMLDPQDLEAVEFVKKRANLKILPRLTDATSIKRALVQYQKDLKSEFGDIIKEQAASIKKIEDTESDVSETDLAKLAEDLPVVRIVETLLDHAILQHASDIHVEPGETEVFIRYRIDGLLHDAMVLPKNAAPGIVARIKVLSNLRLDEKRLPQDGRFKVESDKQGGMRVSFRVSTLPTAYGEKIVMRLLPDTARGYSLESLGFTGRGLDVLHRAMRKTTGLILVTGPTGSGKTTTLYTLLDLLNKPEVNISTVEDPIEYQIPRINQTQVKPDIGLTFARGLRSLVRQDPDIIMVGEIRDEETAALAVNAALTGHLVLSTLHTNSAAGAIPRLLDMGVEPFLLQSTIRVVIGQRLVRRLCKKREEYTLSKDEREELSRYADLDTLLQEMVDQKIVKKSSTWDTITISRPQASRECEDGYNARATIGEVLAVSEGIGRLINSRASDVDIEALARKEGMLTMVEEGIIKSVQGVTSIEEVLRVASD